MPAAPFAAREARADRAVLAHLSNTVGLLDGEEVAGIFDEEYVEAGGIGLPAPAVFVAADVGAGVEVDQSTFVRGNLVDGTIYRVVGAAPGGGGLTLLRLQRTHRAP